MEKNCQLCEKNCPLDELQCPRGHAFAVMNRENGFERFPHAFNHEELSEDAKLMALLRRCAAGYRPRGGWNEKSSQRRVLTILSRVGEITQRELMDILLIRSASLSELLAKLEAKGYISRVQNEQDKRSVNINITQEGRDVASEANAPESPFAALSEEERESLTGLLNKLITAWNQKTGDEPPPFGAAGGGFNGAPPFGGRPPFPPRGGFNGEGFSGDFRRDNKR